MSVSKIVMLSTKPTGLFEIVSLYEDKNINRITSKEEFLLALTLLSCQ